MTEDNNDINNGGAGDGNDTPAPYIGEGSRTHDTTNDNNDLPKKDDPPADDPKKDEPKDDPKDTPKDEPKDKPKDEPKDKKKSLTGLSEDDLKDKVKDDDKKDKKEFVLDQRIYDDEGNISEEKLKEVMQEMVSKEEHGNKRLNDMRRLVGKAGDIPETKEGFFDGYQPPEDYKILFSDDAPEASKEALKKWTEELGDKYFKLGLNRAQADELNNTFLDMMKEVGAIDTRTEEQFEKDREAWIKDQESKLGENAKGIIKTSSNWILNNKRFSETTKSNLLKAMDNQGAEFISVIYELSQASSGSTIPTNVEALGGLKPDAELAQEFLTASPQRKEQIIQQRHANGRTGKLMDALRNQ